DQLHRGRAGLSQIDVAALAAPIDDVRGAAVHGVDPGHAALGAHHQVVEPVAVEVPRGRDRGPGPRLALGTVDAKAARPQPGEAHAAALARAVDDVDGARPPAVRARVLEAERDVRDPVAVEVAGV